MAVARAVQCDHSVIVNDRSAWFALPFVGVVGVPGDYYQQRRCTGCGLVVERSLETPWPIEPTDAARRADAIWQEAQRRADELCNCGHERRSHIDNVAACLDGACACHTFKRTQP